MRRQIAWLTAATTSAVILAFVIPLCLLVRTMAEDRGLASADSEARNTALVISGLADNADDQDLRRLVRSVDARSPAATAVIAPDGHEVAGSYDVSGLTHDPEVRRAAGGEAFTVVDERGARVLVPVLTTAGTYVVRTSLPEDALHHGVVRAWTIIIALGLLLMVSAMLVAAWLGRRIATPVTDLAHVAHRLREGKLDTRAVPNGPRETVELGRALNLLAERISELLAAERTAVGDLSHRLRTPLTALRLDAEAVTDAELNDRLLAHIEALQVTVDSIVKDARRPVRSDLGASCDLVDIARERVVFWSALAEDQDRRCSFDAPAAALVVGIDPAGVRDVIDVLVDNVFAHTPAGTGFSLRLAQDGARARLTVEDTGPGASPGRDDGSRVGSTGLGLQLVRRTVAGVGGDMTMTSSATGTRVDVWLPLERRGVSGAASGRQSPTAP